LKKKGTRSGINNSCRYNLIVGSRSIRNSCALCRLLLHNEEFCTARSNNAITYAFIIRAYSTCQFQVRQALKIRFWEALKTENSHLKWTGIYPCPVLVFSYLDSCRAARWLKIVGRFTEPEFLSR